jgi:hypothetical protein
MPQHQALLSFNAGEVTPYLRHRVDFEKTASSAELCQNLIAQPYGGVMKRPGLRYLQTTRAAGPNSHLLPWVGSDGSKYLLHFTEGKLCVYHVDGLKVSDKNFLNSITWTGLGWSSGLRNLQMVQVNDVAFLTHPFMFPQRLSKQGAEWITEFMPFTRAPMLDENLDESLLMSVYSNPRKDGWTFGTAFAEGDVIQRNGAEWVCTAAHTSTNPTEPGDGEDWKTVWTRRMFKAGDPVTLVFNGLWAEEWSNESPYYEMGTVRRFSSAAVGGLGVQIDGPGFTGLAVCKTSHANLTQTTEIESLSIQSAVFSGATPKWKQIVLWVPYTGGGTILYYTLGDMIWHNNHLYRCTEDPHFANNEAYEPGIGIYWEDVMVDACDEIGLAHWGTLIGTIPKGQEVVTSANALYRSKVRHTSSNTKEPGVDAGWQTYWEPISEPAAFGKTWTHTFYRTGRHVAVAGVVYRCLATHYALVKNKPGSGSVWEDFWVALTLPPSIFDPLHAASAVSPGSHWKLSPERDARDFQVEIAAIEDNDGEASDYIAVQGAWTFNTFGTWFGVFDLERSADGGDQWKVVRSWQSVGDRNVADSGFEDEPVLLRLRFHKEDGGEDETEANRISGKQRGVLAPELPYVTGTALADTYVSSNVMTGYAQTSMLSGRTFRWSEGAFSGYRGFPRAIALHDMRLAYAGTQSRPVSVWLSQTDDLLNFEVGTEATAGLYVTLATSAAQPIRWMASQRRLFLGTAWGEWVCGSETSDQPLSQGNFFARQYSGYGSLNHQPLIANDAIFFAERKGNRLRELAYFSDRESYDAADLSRLAEHLTAEGISNFAWQQTREPGLWVVRRDGVLLHFAYSRTERISAWSRHVTIDGLFRDVAVIPSDDGDDDVFFIVDRDGASCLERFPQNWQYAAENGLNALPFFHVDGVAGTGSTITIPAHLVGKLLNRVVLPTATPAVDPTWTKETMGSTTAALGANHYWQTGYTVNSELVSLPIDQGSESGTTQGRGKRAHKILTSLVNSRGGAVWNVAKGSRQAIPVTLPGRLRTGWEETIPDPGNLVDLQFRLFHDEPWPFTLRAAVLRWELHEF